MFIFFFFPFSAVKKIVQIRISKKYLLQCGAMLLLVAGGYFYRKMIINSVVLIVLIVWGVYQNKSILIPLLSSIKSKVIHE